MERKQNIITITAYVFLMILFFMFGYLIGRSNAEKRFNAQAENTPVRSVSSPTLVPEIDFYSVKIDGDLLLLSRINPNGEEVIYSIEISESIFPPEDIEELKNGVTFSNISEAHAFMENFASWFINKL